MNKAGNPYLFHFPLRHQEYSSWMYKGYPGQHADFQTIVDYWMMVHPEEMKGFQERYYRNLWQVEAEILQRMRLAVARGWGMIQTYYS